MPIGVGTAIAGGAAILGAGASIYGASKAAKAQTNAAESAADTSLQVAQLNNDLYKQIYGQNLGVLSPYVNNGIQPSNALNDLLLGTHSFNQNAAPYIGPGGVIAGAPGTGTGSAASGYTGPSFNDILALKGDHTVGDMGSAVNQWISYYRAHPEENPGINPLQIGGLAGDHVQGDQEAVQAIYDAYKARPATAAPAAGALGAYSGTPTAPAATGVVPIGQRVGERPRLSDYPGDLPAFHAAVDAWKAGPAPTPGGTPTAGGTGTGTGSTGALSAWDQFRNSTNYTFRLNEGENALASNYAAHGAFDSGAEKKALLKYGQNFASNELSNYMNLLAGQQAMGLSAAGAVAGVGTTYAGNVAAQNTAAANSAANAALVAGQGQAGMWGAVGQGVGQVAGALSGYGMSQYPAAAAPAGGYVVNPGTANYYGAHPFGGVTF